MKPSNVMLRKTGEAVLIDFGLSKQYDANGVAESSTSVGGGTPGYAPLEQANYQEGSDFPVTMDVYALGATLFKMLTNVRPPEASVILNDGFPADVLQSKGVSEKTISCIAKAMSATRKQRYQTVSEFITALFSSAKPASVASANNSEETVITEPVFEQPIKDEKPSVSKPEAPKPPKKSNKKLFAIIGGAIAVVVVVELLFVFMQLNIEPLENKQETYPSVSFQNNTLTFEGGCYNMVAVEGGTFQMGSTNVNSSEQPIHSVTLDDYYIGETEVTQALWKAVMGNNPSYSYGDNLPVESVSWDDCQLFIRRLNSLTGKTFRLPTEAEWEFAARGGNNNKGYAYSGSNMVGEVAWYCDNSGDKIHAVKTKSPNELGIYDMSGNVYEWCQDWYGSYSSSAQTNPTGPTSGSYRVYRGGSWDYYASSCRVASRNNDSPSGRYSNLGFRLVLEVESGDNSISKSNDEPKTSADTLSIIVNEKTEIKQKNETKDKLVARYVEEEKVIPIQQVEKEVVETIEIEEEVAPVAFAVVENKPEYPGGDIELMKYLAQNTKYPPSAKENGISGRVFVQFVIDKDGNVTQVKTLRGVDTALDAEAIRVVKSMPKWKPGSQRGNPVPVTYAVPINFKLN